MKKLLVPIFLALLMLVLLAIAVSAQETCPENMLCKNLIAGQNEVVGKLYVWNDWDTVYVKYVTFTEWGMSDTHLQIVVSTGDYETTVDLFPTNKKGTPIPGKFDYQMEWNESQTTYLYEVPLADVFDPGYTWVLTETLAIAAHASLDRAETALVTSQTGVAAYGPVVADTMPLPGADVWGALGSAFEVLGAADLWPGVHISGYDTWISYGDGSALTDTSWVWFHDEVELPDPAEYIYLLNWVAMTSDSAEAFYFNGHPIITDGDWQTVVYTDVVPIGGVNTLDFVVRDDPGGNPAGLLYLAAFRYVAQTETAWAFDEGDYMFDTTRWSAFFEYTLQEPPPPEIFQEWPDGTGTLSLAYEDWAWDDNGGTAGDYDYNDWVIDLKTVATFDNSNGSNQLVQIDFTFLPEARGALHEHEFHMGIPAGIFIGTGNATLTRYAAGNVIYEDTRPFDGSVDDDFNVIPSTKAALPPGTYFWEWYNNTVEPSNSEGIVSHWPDWGPKYTDYTPSQITATLSIHFDTPFTFALPDYSAILHDWHGVILSQQFFDPYIVVKDGVYWTVPDETITPVDPRRLVVPDDWLWLEAGMHIGGAYTYVSEDKPPVFPGSENLEWWGQPLINPYTDGNSTIYQGKLLYESGGTFPITQ